VEATPLHFLCRASPESELAALYSDAEVMLVTPLRDGMNLVAKEYIASRLDGTGVLVLSELAGAADELTDALIVNPYDIDGMAAAIARGGTMPKEEQHQRMRPLRRAGLDHDIHRWADDYLEALTPHAPRAEATPIEP